MNWRIERKGKSTRTIQHPASEVTVNKKLEMTSGLDLT